MSTEVIERSLETMKEDLVQFINDEPLDILDEFTAEEVADMSISIAERLMHRDWCMGHFIKKGAKKRDYLYKVNNRLQGFISFSDDDRTGVSRTEYKPFWFDEEDGYFTGLCSLASMINEAWYLCTSQGDNLGIGVL